MLCLTCKRTLGDPNDPLSLDCGGDCWGCVREAEGKSKMAKDFAVVCATDPGAVEMEFYEQEPAEKYARSKSQNNPSEEYWVVSIKSKYSQSEEF